MLDQKDIPGKIMKSPPPTYKTDYYTDVLKHTDIQLDVDEAINSFRRIMLSSSSDLPGLKKEFAVITSKGTSQKVFPLIKEFFSSGYLKQALKTDSKNFELVALGLATVEKILVKEKASTFRNLQEILINLDNNLKQVGEIKSTPENSVFFNSATESLHTIIQQEISSAESIESPINKEILKSYVNYLSDIKTLDSSEPAIVFKQLLTDTLRQMKAHENNTRPI